MRNKKPSKRTSKQRNKQINKQTKQNAIYLLLVDGFLIQPFQANKNNQQKKPRKKRVSVCASLSTNREKRREREIKRARAWERDASAFECWTGATQSFKHVTLLHTNAFTLKFKWWQQKKANGCSLVEVCKFQTKLPRKAAAMMMTMLTIIVMMNYAIAYFSGATRYCYCTTHSQQYSKRTYKRTNRTESLYFKLSRNGNASAELSEGC